MKLRLRIVVCSLNSVLLSHPLTVEPENFWSIAGNLIKANDDTAMVTLNQITPIKVSFTVPGKNLPEIKKYQAAGSLQVQLPDIKG